MTDMRRTLLWGVFLVSLFLIYDAWNRHTGHPSMFAPSAAKQAARPVATPGSASVAGATVPSATGAAAAPTIAASAPARSETVTVTTDLVKATFDTQGGTLVRLELLKQVDKEDKTKPVVLFDRSPQHVYVAQTGVVGVPNAPTHLSPMNLLPGERELKNGRNELSVAFESAEQGGLRLVKTYTLRRGTYVIDVKHELRNLGTTPVASPQVYLQLMRDGQAEEGSALTGTATFTGPALYTENSKFRKIEFKEVDKGTASYDKAADNGWISIVQHYFVSAWLHTKPQQREFMVRWADPADTGLPMRVYIATMVFTLPAIAPGGQHVFDAVLFAGPQEEEKLAELAPGLQLVKDYGMLKILAEPLFWLLSQLHKLIGNWGWAIVALVVLLKIAFYWLNASAYRSMAKMKAIGPKVTELRERYKDKPQQMQQEMMRIYREEKVNPLGGCLPILVQMPFFIALYWVLLSTVEMRHAPWIGWITDLSARDPYFILPALMTATSLVQVALGAKPPDPMQARMMWIMPLAFSVMFFVFPAGLVLYWLTNNILSIAQQYLINKQMGVAGK
jgi:YidC/Oxa1 family membrane protein insertase